MDQNSKNLGHDPKNPEQPSQIPGQPYQIPGQPSHIPGQLSQTPELSQIPGQLSQIPGQLSQPTDLASVGSPPEGNVFALIQEEMEKVRVGQEKKQECNRFKINIRILLKTIKKRVPWHPLRVSCPL